MLGKTYFFTVLLWLISVTTESRYQDKKCLAVTHAHIVCLFLEMAYDLTFIGEFLIGIFETKFSKQPIGISKKCHTVLTINAL